jgi:hypothetical protein
VNRHLSLILAVILLITCSGCIWGWEHDRRGYDDRDRGERGYQDRERGEHDRGEHGDRDRRGVDDHR